MMTFPLLAMRPPLVYANLYGKHEAQQTPGPEYPDRMCGPAETGLFVSREKYTRKDKKIEGRNSRGNSGNDSPVLVF
jgi:hypothetical protein